VIGLLVLILLLLLPLPLTLLLSRQPSASRPQIDSEFQAISQGTKTLNWRTSFLLAVRIKLGFWGSLAIFVTYRPRIREVHCSVHWPRVSSDEIARLEGKRIAGSA